MEPASPSPRSVPDLRRPLNRMGMMNAKVVAKAGYRGLMAGKTIVIPGFMNKFGAQSVRFAPRRFVTSVVRKIQNKVH